MNQITESVQAHLLLADGTLFVGKSFGAAGTAGGELCFNTGMTGYQEVFTDPSYTGQVLIMNNAYIGNYGVKATDVESGGVKINAVIAKNVSNRYSRMVAEDSLGNYLKANNVVAIHGVDTRALVQHVRNRGAMNCIVSTEISDPDQLKEALARVPDMAGLELSSIVSAKAPYEVGDTNARRRIAVLDFGVKRNILKCLSDRDAYLKVFPARTSAAELEAFQPDGFFLSNGPGDPASMDYAVQTVRSLLATGKPLFGICLGHQLLARANNVPTYKMHHGHRGLNHPVLNMRTGKAETTTQNHGFAVDHEAVKNHPELELTHVNLNDGTVEGLRMKGRPAFSVQYHPESTPGPHDSRYLFDEFFALFQ